MRLGNVRENGYLLVSKEDLQPDSQVALITGCSSGIGLLAAVELARAGFRVVATMRDPGRCERLDAEAAREGVGGRIDVRRLDVTDFPALPGLVDSLLRDYGRLDAVVNNAGFAMAGFAEDLSVEEVKRQLETNFFGHVALTRAVLPAMRRQASGHIIMVSSISGRAGQPGVSAYSASKFALEGWTETLRLETRALGIKVVLIEPGAFDTEIWERNVQLGAVTTSGQSPNSARGQKLREWSRKTRKRDARVVARLIARVARHPNPRLRYLVGADAKLHFALRAILPWKWYERMVTRLVGI